MWIQYDVMDDEIYDKAYKMGLRPRRTPKGYSILCPLHEDHNHSAIVYSNDGFAQCFAGCGRWRFMDREYADRTDRDVKDTQHIHSTIDVYEQWLDLEPLTEGVKSFEASYLNKLGWRKLPDGNIFRLPAGIFIPAFSEDKKHVPFFQVRHLGGTRRFSFPSGAEQIPFGLETLEQGLKFVVFTEGNTDRATLELAGIHAVALPSGSSGKLLRHLADYAREAGKTLVAISDNDAVGDKLLDSLNGYSPYIDARVKGYKDISEAMEDKGIEWVKKQYKWLKEK